MENRMSLANGRTGDPHKQRRISGNQARLGLEKEPSKAVGGSGVLPNFFVVGAMKGGTTALSDALAAHPDVYCTPIKEPSYFAGDLTCTPQAQHHRTHVLDPEAFVSAPMRSRASGAWVNSLATYQALFHDHRGERAIGDCSATYLYSRVAARAIREAVPAARIVISLRNPVTRAFSEYLHNRVKGWEKPPFRSAVERELASRASGHMPVMGIEPVYVSAGLYAEQVQRFLECFPREQVLILFQEDTKKDFAGTMRQICRHIGVDPAVAPQEPVISNSAKRPRLDVINEVLYASGLKTLISRYIPARLKELGKTFYYSSNVREMLTEDDRLYLSDIFADDIQRLSRLVDRDLSHWLQRAPGVKSTTGQVIRA
jgi:hypothetical protein